MKVITFSIFKGGTAKTTSTVNTAAALAAKGKKVLVIDLDQQASATRYLDHDERSAPAEDLRFGKKPLSASSARDSGEISKLGTGKCGSDADRPVAAPDAKKQGLPVCKVLRNERRKLVRVRKACRVQAVISAPEEGRGCDQINEHPGAEGKFLQAIRYSSVILLAFVQIYEGFSFSLFPYRTCYRPTGGDSHHRPVRERSF